MLQLPAMEADLFGALKDSALDVLEVRADAAGLSNVAYAKIRKQGGGDAKQALAVMLGSSKMAIPKIAYVFDEDVDIGMTTKSSGRWRSGLTRSATR
jgi:2,5-furandicarboxylate decarboxylase 1